jgi:hypothetical protein
MYLWERGYLTRKYRANGLVSFLDGKVAALVGYAEARPNFAMLNEIPLRLREHAERQEEVARAASDAVAALENAAVDAAGGKSARAALQAAQKRIAEIDAQMVAAEDRRDEQAKARRDLAEGSDPAFAGAVAALAEALAREDVKVLLQEARATATGRDDSIVGQIDAARQRAAEEDLETRDQKARLKTLAARRRELEDIQYEFRKSGFDTQRSSFGNDKLVGDLLNDFLRGGITAAAYWDAWQRSHNWSGPSNDPWNFDERFGRGGGNFNWPDNSFGGGGSSSRSRGHTPISGGNWGRLPGGFGGGGNSGGFSRPRSGSSGSRSGGGFKTGGGF